jgi:phospholipid/cholesterol/gamma-HCH transport system permease protein
MAEAVFNYVSQLLSICALFYRLLLSTFASAAGLRLLLRETASQVYFTALQGAHVLIFTALMLGLVVIVHATQQLVKVQGEEFVGWLLVTLVVREVGPVWAAFFVLLRSGSAITAELATLSVTREIEALKMMGIDPYRYLGVPRFWGLTISLVALYVLCTFAAVMGGFLFAQIFADVFWGKFWVSFINSLQWLDLAVGFAKCTLFGMVIATVSIYFGFQAEKHLGEVALYTSKGALTCLVLLGAVDIILTSAYYL